VGSDLFAVTPEVLRQALASATRTAIQYNWEVSTVVSSTEITVKLHNPNAAAPFLTPSTYPWYQNALVEFITGPLAGIAPDSNGQASTTGRVTTVIKSISSTANPGGPPTTTITFIDPLPASPNPGDRFVVYYAQVGSFNVPVSGNVNVGTISGTVTIPPASGATFNVGTVSGNVSVQPATGAVFNVGTVSGTVTITPASGATFNVGTISGTVTVTPASGATFNVGTISGTVTVTPASGATFNVGTVSGNVSVQPASGVTFDIGTVSGTVNVAQSGTWNIGSVGSITETVQGNVVNDVLPAQAVVFLGSAAFAVSNLANGNTVGGEIDATTSLLNNNGVLLDGLIVGWTSQNGYQYNFDSASAFLRNTNATGPYDDHLGTNSVTVTGTSTFGPGNNGLTPPLFFSSPWFGNCTVVQLTNATGSTISSDTVTIFVWGIKAQITNPTNNPANTQPGQGSFATAVASSIDGSVGGSGTSFSTTLINSGGYLEQLQWQGLSGTGYNGSSTQYPLTLTLYNGSVPIASTTVTAGAGNTTVTLPNGSITYRTAVANNGIILTITMGGNIADFSVSWYLVTGATVSATPPSRVGVIV